jgi:membrane protease YdiL (CAAX protease family)
MQGDEFMKISRGETLRPPQPIASRRHLLGFLLIGAGVVALGLLAQHGSTGSAPDQLGQHRQAIPVYLTAILMDWALFYYCWVGVHRHGGNLRTLSGGLWSSWKALAIDLAIALPFWIAWESAAYGVHWLLGASSAKTVDSLLPHSPLEVVIWIATSVTAGFCEEIAFRGYVQQQLQAYGKSMAVAVIGQGVVFGLFHAYQGWKNVIVISVLGVMFGVLAAWRRNLRANIIVHAWADVWSGWLKFLLWR